MSKKFKFLCIGNSHTAGFPYFDPIYGGNPQSSYEYWLEYFLSREFPLKSFYLDNKGICGQMSAQVYTRLKDFLNKFRYDLIILWTGANDVAFGYSAQKVWKNLWKGYELTKQFGSIFLLVTIPPMDWLNIGKEVISLNKKIILNSYEKYYYADVYSALAENYQLKPVYDVGDGVHLSIRGYKKVGKVIFNSIASRFKSNT